MRYFERVKLSSKFTGLTFWGMLALAVILPLALVALILSTDHFAWNVLLGYALFAAGIALSVWVGTKICYASIVDNHFHLQKFFRPKKIYPLSALVDLNTYDVGRDHYIVFTMQENGSPEKYLVYTSRSIFYRDERIDSEEILREILAENQSENTSK